MPLLDAYERPIRTQALTQRIAEPGITGVRQAWADSVASGLTPARLASVLRQAAEGDLYSFVTLAEEMEEKDPHYGSVLGMRKRAISGVEPTVKPASDSPHDKKIAEAVTEAIAEHDDFTDLLEDLMDAVGKGFSVIELDWARSKREWWFKGFEYVDPRWITVDRDTGKELRLLDESDPANGIALEPGKFVVHTSRLKSGLPGRQGLARLVAFTWMCKAYSVKDWMAFVETYGLPLRLGRYNSSATPEDVEVLFRAVANIGTDAAAVLPESMRIDFEDASNGQGNEIFENLARWGDEQISKAVLGQTMTSDNGSSMAQAKVHNDVRLDIAQSDARKVSGAINRHLVRPYVDLNFGVQDTYPRVMLSIEEPEDVDLIMRNVFRMVTAGLRVPAAPVRQRLGIPEPKDGDELIGLPAPPAEGGTGIASNRTEATGGDPFELLQELEGDLASEWEDVMGPILEPLLGQLEAAADFDSAQDIIRKAFPNMSNPALIEKLVVAMVQARGVGDQRDG